jgi:hypothetical protein
MGRRGHLDHGRQGNADGLEHGAGTAGSGGTKAKPPFGVGLTDLIEVADDVGLSELTAGSDQTVDQFLTQKQCKERAKYVSSKVLSALTPKPIFAQSYCAGSRQNNGRRAVF